MAYEDKKSRFEILDVVRVQDHNKADQIASGAAFAVTVPAENQADLLTVFKAASAKELRQIFSAIVNPKEIHNGKAKSLIKPKNVIAIMHQGQGGILNNDSSDFYAEIFDKEVSRKNEDTSHIVSRRTFVPRFKAERISDINFDNRIPFTKDFKAFNVRQDTCGESTIHKVLVCRGKLSEFFDKAPNEKIRNFKRKFLKMIEKAGKDNNGQVRVVIEHNKFISAHSGENLSQEMKVLEDKDGNEYLEGYRWFENPHPKKLEIS